MKKQARFSWTWPVLVAGSAVGAIASFVQLVERIQFADKPLQALTCDINSVFSCSSVFDAWQSSVFGFSNAILCLLFFGVMLGVGLAGLFGGTPSKGLRLVMQFFSLFFLAFGAWYLQQSAFAIQALCIFCIFCYAGVIAINWAWLRINAQDLPLPKTARARLRSGIDGGIDTFIWLLWAAVVAAMFILAFA